MKKSTKKRGPQRRSKPIAPKATTPSYADIWAQKLISRPALPVPTVEKVFAGLPCRVKRMTFFDYWRAGELPAYLSQVVVGSLNGEEVDTAAVYGGDELTREDKAMQMMFMRHLTCTSLEDPKVVPNDNPGPGEISYARLFLLNPNFIWELYAWFSMGCPDFPIMTTEGETTLESVENFRQEQILSGAGSNDEVRPTAK